jgi:UDP-N-acetylglucosamine 4,6-dehydratase
MQLKGRIFITGGSGSLGTAILERAEREKWDAEFTILARNETKMSQTLKRFPGVRGEIGDIRDLAWLGTIFPGHDLVIHTAAIKQVPTAEVNVREAFLTNVQGSQNVAMAAVESGVGKVIGISTDKACQPTTIYGCTKYLMEGLFREANKWADNTRFNLVRYGNVLRSNASVVPLFERLISEDKPFTITDLRMTRFWLSMNEAIDLIITSVLWPDWGITLVPKPPALSMIDLARYMDGSRKIIEVGIRPGEKVHEQLINSSESLHTIDTGDLFVVFPPTVEVNSNLPLGYEYVSNDPSYYLSKEKLYKMLDEYNPYGGKQWLLSEI